MDLLVKLDLKLSSILHRADNIVLTVILYPFSHLFHNSLIWAVFLTVFILSNFNLEYVCLYGLGSGIAGIITWLMKRRFKRVRPQMIQEVNKPKKFRKKQKNFSMPSGDAFQSGVLTYFLYDLGVPAEIACCFLILVCVSRVYYMCHWLLDTVVGAALGLLIGWLDVKFIQTNPWILNIFDFWLAVGYQWLHITLGKNTGQLL